jgi:hypothetical protein
MIHSLSCHAGHTSQVNIKTDLHLRNFGEAQLPKRVLLGNLYDGAIQHDPSLTHDEHLDTGFASHSKLPNSSF